MWHYLLSVIALFGSAFNAAAERLRWQASPKLDT
jgi:uncharacterized BrkB/YihY/UPF0761 family membrane protein